uniref:Putative salivary kunitz domain protein n=1 Tax=Ixodes ricinus TaxID=34613 RepID=A0A0K8R5A5_IXORI
MRASGILFLFAMCFLVNADGIFYSCTREWPVPFRQCLILCQHGELTFRELPTFTLEEKPNGTHCRRFFRLFAGECLNGRCVKPEGIHAIHGDAVEYRTME